MIQQPRLPYVQFRSEAAEVKDKDGHVTYVNKYWADIVPAGGKDVLVKDADEWVRELKHKGETRGPFDTAANEYRVWHEHFDKALKQFKAGEEMTTVGTPLRAILAFTKSEVAQAEAVRIYSLEDLAAANEEAMRHMGIGARGMKDRAQMLVEGASGTKLLEENAALKSQVEALTERVDALVAAGLKEENPEQRRGPGRPRKVEEAA